MNFILCILQQPEGRRRKKKNTNEICVSKSDFYFISLLAGTVNALQTNLYLVTLCSLATENEKKKSLFAGSTQIPELMRFQMF